MHDHTSNALAGVSIALASLGGLFAQAPPGAVSVWGSVIVLATLLVRAVQEVATRWLALQTAKIDVGVCNDKIHALELEIAGFRKMAGIGVCPLDPTGQGLPACLRKN